MHMQKKNKDSWNSGFGKLSGNNRFRHHPAFSGIDRMMTKAVFGKPNDGFSTEAPQEGHKDKPLTHSLRDGLGSPLTPILPAKY